MAKSSAIATPTENRKIDKVFINGETFDIWSNTEVKSFNVSSATDLANIQKALNYYRTWQFCTISLAWYWTLYPTGFWSFRSSVRASTTDWTMEQISLDGWVVIVWLLVNYNTSGTVTRATLFQEISDVIISASDFEKLSQGRKDNWTHYFIYEEE